MCRYVMSTLHSLRYVLRPRCCDSSFALFHNKFICVHQYPDGYLEAEAEKKALKEKNSKATKGGKKRALRESNVSEWDGDASPPGKKRKTAKKETPDSKKNGECLKSLHIETISNSDIYTMK